MRFWHLVFHYQAAMNRWRKKLHYFLFPSAAPVTVRKPSRLIHIPLKQIQILNMITNFNLISCNFLSPSLPLRIPKLGIAHQNQTQKLRSQIIPFKFPIWVSPNFNNRRDSSSSRMSLLQKCRTAGDPDGEKSTAVETERGGGNGGEGRDWTTSILLFVFWAALMYYVFNLAPNQTPVYYIT